MKTLTKTFGAWVVVASIAVSLLPATTAHMQGQSPLPTPPPPPPTAVPKPPAAPRASRIPTPKLITKTIIETDATVPFEINVRYPAIDNVNAPWATFNADVLKQVQDTISAFKTDLQAMMPITGMADTDTMTSTLYGAFQTFRVTRDFVSVRMGYSLYIAGAAHPASFSRVLNFDANAGKLIELNELFKSVNTDYLGTLSGLCKRQLERRDVLAFPEGLDPKPDNFATWNMGRFNLIITFDPYQVAPYAVGPQECEIPLRTLRRILAEPRRW